MIEYNETRISKLRDYLFNVIETLTNDIENINADMLSNDINNYSIDKIPVETEIERWIIGPTIRRDVFSFRSRVAYSQDTINNLENIGFFEKFENIIKSNNEKGVLPEIDNVEKIECLNCATLNIAGTKTAEFDIQIQVTYRDNNIIDDDISL